MKNNKKTIDEKVQKISREQNASSLSQLNHKLDLIRNAIFNLIVSYDYMHTVPSVKDLDNLVKVVNTLDKEITEYVLKTSIQFNNKRKD